MIDCAPLFNGTAIKDAHNKTAFLSYPPPCRSGCTSLQHTGGNPTSIYTLPVSHCVLQINTISRVPWAGLDTSAILFSTVAVLFKES